MFPSLFALTVLVSLLSNVPPVFATTLYTWRNADGSIMFTDSPRGASVQRNQRSRPSIMTRSSMASRAEFSTLQSPRIERQGEGAGRSHGGG